MAHPFYNVSLRYMLNTLKTVQNPTGNNGKLYSPLFCVHCLPCVNTASSGFLLRSAARAASANSSHFRSGIQDSGLRVLHDSFLLPSRKIWRLLIEFRLLVDKFDFSHLFHFKMLETGIKAYFVDQHGISICNTFTKE